MLFQTVTGEIQ